jgi:single-stranded-DNA-specific exonuclease
VLVHHGLKRIARSPGVGVRALLRSAEVDPASVNAGRVGFQIAPRINAAGRIGETTDALSLLLTDDEGDASALAYRLGTLNRERRDEVASRVVDRIHRPVVMLARDGGIAKGSARSVPGFDLYAAVAACAEHLERFGGHRQAAGMQLAVESIPAFREAFQAEAREHLSPELLEPVLRPDLDVDLADADVDLAHWLGYLGPHGMGNRGPLFRARGVEVAGAREVGTGHLKASLRAGRATLGAIGFGMVERFPPATLDSGRWDALFRLEKNEFRGRVDAQARLVDLRPEAS